MGAYFVNRCVHLEKSRSMIGAFVSRGGCSDEGGCSADRCVHLERARSTSLSPGVVVKWSALMIFVRVAGSLLSNQIKSNQIVQGGVRKGGRLERDVRGIKGW